MGTYKIAVLPGDGIGPEVTTQALRVLERVGARFGHTFQTTQALVGAAAIEAEGDAISDATMALCQESDAILFGAVGGVSRYEGPNSKVQPERALFRLRKELELFANLRPVRPFKALLNASTLKPSILEGTDLLVVRELTGGIYFGKPSEIRQTPHGLEAIDTLLYSEGEIERIVRTAFELARGRTKKKVTSVDKANVLSSSRLWRRVAERVAADYPDITFEHLLVDACAMHLIRRPASFDVIVTENMFGDILTDEASMLAGSMGMLPSASLGTRQTAHGTFGLYEPIHGSAPDIAGQNKANPIASILSLAMLLRHSLSLEAEAQAVERAVEQVIDAGYRTEDLQEAGTTIVGTEEMGRLIAEAVTATSS
ncbi:MAG: 3-isopropylmalate dehydrogenase [Thermogemmatispora sp.]|uniref:3-isopropylmalate dehydrogenase n=1 Tax=Thermogemmatispora aurantia TaxID=2045279 RepID=A0A5J4K5B0_9CHLR|nr:MULTISPECIES: 3-isopropylmalate dehydrogenase [Thermogemmatispora]MBE3564792.1 3-isopropylmalate dehydrogenase [Thermogemmatispora sp.]GER81859.1 3-isopropylmalate dehydrogenase [Thermogemmatispora aurantia]